MVDTRTRERLRVSTDGNAGPYIMVPVDQLDETRSLLDASNVGYWVDEQAISLDGKPEITVINLGRGGDVARIQRLLDSMG
jgi:hypothetical protein